MLITRKVTIMRGAPGAGKSTFVKKNFRGKVYLVSADHFFLGRDGVYRFDPSKIQEAHNACWRAFASMLAGNAEHIVVDNSNITLNELGAYWLPATANGWPVEVITVRCSYDELLRRNDERPEDQRVSPQVIARYVERMRVMDALIPDYWWHTIVHT